MLTQLRLCFALTAGHVYVCLLCPREKSLHGVLGLDLHLLAPGPKVVSCTLQERMIMAMTIDQQPRQNGEEPV
jgi:hypothetical protein